MSTDQIQQYPARLRASLPGRNADQVMAEAEDHLRETERAGLAAGLTEPEAQAAAISAFGSVTAVVRAHRARYLMSSALADDLATATWKLIWLILLAADLTGVLDIIMEFAVGGDFLTGLVPNLTAAQCRRIMSQYPYAAGNCSQASFLGGSHGLLTACAVAGLRGVIVCLGYVAMRGLQLSAGRAPWQVLPTGFFPAVAVSAFGLLAAGLAWRTGVIAADGNGPGGLMTGALVAMAVAVFYAVRLRRAQLKVFNNDIRLSVLSAQEERMAADVRGTGSVPPSPRRRGVIAGRLKAGMFADPGGLTALTTARGGDRSRRQAVCWMPATRERAGT